MIELQSLEIPCFPGGVTPLSLSLDTKPVATAASVEPMVAPSDASDRLPGTDVNGLVASLSEAFGEPFTVVDVESGDLVHSDCDGLSCDFYGRIELLSAVSRRGRPEIVEDLAPLAMLAVPLRNLGVGEKYVAVGLFVNQRVTDESEMAAAARCFGIDVGRALRWSATRTVWPTRVLEQMAHTVLENLTQRLELSRLREEAVDASTHLADVYAELELLHHLTSQLHLSENEQELWQNALSWLADTIPAQCLVIVSRTSKDSDLTNDDLAEWSVMSEGECPADRDELCELIRRFGSAALRRPILLNRAETTLPTWHCPTIRELVCVPIEGGEASRGWLLALNHRGSAKPEFCDFGSVEIQLLSSVGTILGIHDSNLGLYREQSQLFASSVQALTSAIDAKDRYTSGHSNRVAYLSLKLAEQLGLSEADRETIYLAGLLHDIGKIGIDDQVLNKAGQLTDEEFEHIKLHPQLGYDILQGVQQLDKVLPIVLHHHEAWDGSGYPHGLQGTETPRMARIMAVADAFDAMSSDRPYRKGMPDEKLDAIFREGAGSQWDAEVIEAFFAIRDEARRCSQVSSCQASLECEYAVK